ncbi:hypothetical protein H2200_007535 [Cladophialophora chaetospira]|uniref:Uncharacterized protein n=1 Tax=Cladophialophora chaetospira TaxID=386627 RepID=A0AA39CHL6_9EURO|nr:hypothetical protein H2200_007535 [Cladophialophora chaetospira]
MADKPTNPPRQNHNSETNSTSSDGNEKSPVQNGAAQARTTTSSQSNMNYMDRPKTPVAQAMGFAPKRE